MSQNARPGLGANWLSTAAENSTLVPVSGAYRKARHRSGS